MANLAGILNAPIAWQTAATDPDIESFLSDLQANIVKGHGRQHSGHIFLSFAGMAPEAVASLLRSLAEPCTNALTQLRANKRLPPYRDGGTVRCLFLSATGFKALGTLAKPPPGAAFAAGMSGRAGELNDPPRASWHPTGWGEERPSPDAMLLVANDDEDSVTRDLEDAEGQLNGSGATLLVVERGLQQTKIFDAAAEPLGVEHFGYVDGRSQPLFLAEDIAIEMQSTGGDQWNPQFKPSQFIVADPNGTTTLSAGSYFVFRKLEQNVRGFKAAEKALANALGLTGEDEERAGAMVVGRFEDGTPLVLSDTALALAPENNFNFNGDPDALKCPFHAHIRKTNPRGDIKRELNLPNDAGERSPIMARRGITYGQRPMKPDGSDFADGGHEPTQDVGLLFMAYMASIEAQFEFTQQSWANNPDFVGNLNPASARPKTGIDPLIGQSPNAATKLHTYQDGWTAGAQPKQFSFADFVKMQGGEYFFAPSLGFLRNVGL